MAAVKWKFLLARTSDLQPLGDLTVAKNKKLQLQLNLPGRFDFTIRGTQPIASQIVEHSTCVLAIRNGKLVWSGPVFNTDDELPDDTCQCTALGWFEILNHRLLMTGVLAPSTMPSTDATSLTYAQVDQGAIAVDLLVRTNSQWPSLINPGSIASSGTFGLRTLTVQQFQNIGQQIQQLSTFDFGYDFDIDPASRELNIYFGNVKANTTIYGRGQDQPKVIFGFRWGPSNLLKIGRVTDGTKTADQVFTLGQYGVGFVPDLSMGPTAQILRNGLLQDQVSLSQVPGAVGGTPIPQAAFLTAYAAAEVSVRGDPQQIFNLTPRPFTGDKSVPEPLVDYGLGDIVYFGSNYGRIKIPASGTTPQAMRIFGMTFSPDDQGVERLDSFQGVMTSS